MKNKISYKGFTLIEILLVITLIGVLLSIGLVNLNTANRLAEARNDIRKTHIKTLEGAIIQYKLQTGNYPTGLNRNYQEICDPEASSSSCIGFLNLKTFLVPTYLQAIPQDPNDTDNTGGNGYSLAVDVATNTVSIRAIQAEGGVEVKINDPLPAQESVTTNTPLAATVPKLPIVTDGLIFYLDAGNIASYPGTGTTWTDLSGNNNNGTLVNGVGFNSANGGSLFFNGSNQYVNLGPFFTYQNFTISLWVYPGSTQGQYADIFDNNHTGFRNFVLQQNNLNTNQYGFGVNDSSGFISGVSFNLTANVWTHLTFTFTPSDRVIGYINGQFHSQGALANNRNILYQSQNLSIARWSAGGRHWNG